MQHHSSYLIIRQFQLLLIALVCVCELLFGENPLLAGWKPSNIIEKREHIPMRRKPKVGCHVILLSRALCMKWAQGQG
jgi:hypothetical protein